MFHAVCGLAFMSIAAAPPSSLRLPRDVVPRAYALQLDARTHADGYSGTEQVRVVLRRPAERIWLDAQGLVIDQAELLQGGQRIPAAIGEPDANGRAPFVPLHPAAAGPATLAITFHGEYGSQNEGFYKVVEAGEPYLVTQFEATAARKAFPCFDEPGFKAPLTLQLTVDADAVVAANAPIAREEKVSGGKRVTFETTAPLPTYLYAWTVGPFDVVTAPPIPPSAVRRRPLPLRGLAPKGQGPQLADALSEASKLVTAEEAYFGIAYPWKKLDLEAVPDFEAGAMENAGLITFRSDILLINPASASALRRKHLSIDLAHELAHQWFGDLVTLAWWDDVWLNESFASWMETRAVNEVHPEYRMALSAAVDTDAAMYADSLASARQIRQPIRTTADIHDAFDEITYEKGQAVIRMFEQYVGEDVFRAAIHAYLRAHANRTATSADLLSALSKAAGHDVATPFRTFLDQPGVPRVDARIDCDAHGARVELAQARNLPRGSTAKTDLLWQIPVCLRVAGASAPQCTLLATKTATLALHGACPAWVLPDAAMSGYYRWTLPASQLASVSHAQLAPIDRFAVSSAIVAGYRASAIPSGAALGALATLASDPTPEVSAGYADVAVDVLQHLADDAWRPAVRAELVRAYAKQQSQLGLVDHPGDGDAALERRGALTEILAEQADDAPLRAGLAERGGAYLDGEHVDPKAVAPELARYAVECALSAEPARLERTIGRFLDETDETARGNLLDGLSLLRDPVSAARIRALALNPRTRVNETMHPYFVQAADDRTRPAEWDDFKRNFDAIAARVGQEAHGYLPMLAGNPCTEAGAADVQAFFAPRAKADPDLARGAAEQVERIRLCAARAEAQRASAKAYFTAR